VKIELVDSFIVWVYSLSVIALRKKKEYWDGEIEKSVGYIYISRKLIFYIKLILTFLQSIKTSKLNF
jgi:hypothetical protein